MRPSDEGCWRVPVLDEGEPVELVVRRSYSDGFRRVRRARNNALWGPIVNALDAGAAAAKVEHMYPGASIGEPVEICPPGRHFRETQRHNERWLSEHGYR